MYEVYVRSFADGNGDGIGDLWGVLEHLEDLAALGVDALWLTPFYPSGGVDGGYDVADYFSVDPDLGDLGVFATLCEQAHALGIRILVDVVPNHTSSAHPWFQAALAGDSAAQDRYLIVPGTPDQPPNNWQSFFGGPAWEYEPAFAGWYCHLFAKEQPDLNWQNPRVTALFDHALAFWSNLGADGYRFDVAHGLVKDALLRDDPVNADTAALLSEWRATGSAPVLHWRSFDQDEVFAIHAHWREVSDHLDMQDGREHLLVAELSRRIPPPRVTQYLQEGHLHTAFNFRLLDQPWESAPFAQAIQESLAAANDARATPTWVLSNHDRPRQATRYGDRDDRSRAAAALLLGLPGSAYLYQGEELGLPEVEVPRPFWHDPSALRSGEPGRDGCRVPYPWSNVPYAGFSPVEPRAFMPAGWERFAQRAQVLAPTSLWAWYRTLLTVRRTVNLDARSAIVTTSDGIVAVQCAAAGGMTFACVVAFDDRPMQLRLLDLGAAVTLAQCGPIAFVDGVASASGPAALWLCTRR